MKVSRYLLFVAWLPLAACSKDDNADVNPANSPATTTASKQADEDLKDISQFRLTMDRIDRYYDTQRNIMLKLKEMTPEERERADVGSNADDNLDQMVAKAEANPIVSDAARKANSSPREYVMVTVALFQTAMASSVAQMQPKANQDSLIREMKANPDNVKFIRENDAALKQKQTAFQAEMKQMGIKED